MLRIISQFGNQLPIKFDLSYSVGKKSISSAIAFLLTWAGIIRITFNKRFLYMSIFFFSFFN